MCMERVKLNSSACKFYCCPVTQTLLYTLLYLHFFNSYQLERGKNTAFPEGTAKTPFSTRTGKKKIKKLQEKCLEDKATVSFCQNSPSARRASYSAKRWMGEHMK